MPGVPRSKGCENCRRRKKGCDLQNPCGRCDHLGLKCGNFGKGLKFVDETVTLADKWKPTEDQRRRDSPHARTSEDRARSLNTLVFAADSLAKSGHQSQAIGEFWDAYNADTSRALTANHSTMISEKWLQASMQKAHADPALNSALLTLAFSRISRVHADENIRQQATLHYNDAMKHIRKALNHPERRTDDTLLAAVMILGTYEIHEGSQRRGPAWVAHVDGASKLISIRGSRNIASEFAKILYYGHLMNELISAIGSRNRTRQTHPVPVIPISTTTCPVTAHEIALLHILNRIPAIMQHADAIKLLTDPSTIMLSTQSLATRSQSVMDDLDEWQASLADLHNGATYWQAPSLLYASLPEDSDERIFSTMLVFPSLVTAYHLSTLWCCLLLLHSTLFLTYRHIRTHHPEISLDSAISNIPQHTPSSCNHLALLITQSLEYFVQPDTGLVGAQQVGFPISVALGYFQFFQRRETLWFRVIFRRLRELNVGIEGFLESVFNEQGLKLLTP